MTDWRTAVQCQVALRVIDNIFMKCIMFGRILKSKVCTKQRGFTLIEIMTAVVISVVLIAIAAPNFASLVRSSKLRSAQSELVSSLTLTRNEAIKRGLRVSVAGKSPVIGNEFGAGWTVWVDTNEDGVVDPGEVVIREYPGFFGTIIISTVGNVSAINFEPTGFTTTAVSFKVCANADASTGYAIVLQRVGLADISEGSLCPG